MRSAKNQSWLVNAVEIPALANMTLRDLTDKQKDRLVKECEAHIERRNKGRRINNPLPVEYKIGFSDGITTILARLDYLPNAKS